MSTDAGAARSPRFYDRYTTPSAGALLVTYALSLIFLWFGCLKSPSMRRPGSRR